VPHVHGRFQTTQPGAISTQRNTGLPLPPDKIGAEVTIFFYVVRFTFVPNCGTLKIYSPDIRLNFKGLQSGNRSKAWKGNNVIQGQNKAKRDFDRSVTGRRIGVEPLFSTEVGKGGGVGGSGHLNIGKSGHRKCRKRRDRRHFGSSS
jgi:hypothetical protein